MAKMFDKKIYILYNGNEDKEVVMTLEALENAIRRLVLLRQKVDYTNTKELYRINDKLSKLYDLKWTMLSQMNEEDK